MRLQSSKERAVQISIMNFKTS